MIIKKENNSFFYLTKNIFHDDYQKLFPLNSFYSYLFFSYLHNSK